MINLSQIEWYYNSGPGTLCDVFSDEFMKAFGEFIAVTMPVAYSYFVKNYGSTSYLELAQVADSELHCITSQNLYHALYNFLLANDNFCQEFHNFII